jgi:uncharacterized membrane protein
VGQERGVSFPTRTACDCGAAVTFDADHEATTCGGLAVRGGYVCAAGCGRSYMAPGTVAAESSTWSLAKGGRSVDTGRVRLRPEGRGDVERLMGRVVRLPELERALKRIAAGEPDPAAIAAAALDLGEPPAVTPDPEAA